MVSSSSKNSQLAEGVKSGGDLRDVLANHCYIVEVPEPREGMSLAECHPTDVLCRFIDDVSELFSCSFR